MQRFKKGDPVLILPRFAHLYPDNLGIVIAAMDDPFRSMFNSYILQFSDRSTGNLFEFQIIENPPNYTTMPAVVAFDSRQHQSPKKPDQRDRERHSRCLPRMERCDPPKNGAQKRPS